MEERIWFKTKKYGWGWTSASREGWAVIIGGMAVFLAFVGLAVAFAESAAPFALFTGAGIVAVTVMVYVSWRTGEKPRWRWGGE